MMAKIIDITVFKWAFGFSKIIFNQSIIATICHLDLEARKQTMRRKKQTRLRTLKVRQN